MTPKLVGMNRAIPAYAADASETSVLVAGNADLSAALNADLVVAIDAAKPIVVLGGLVTSTALNLIVVPAGYALIFHPANKEANESNKDPQEPTD